MVKTCLIEMLLGSDYLERLEGFINCRTGRRNAETMSLESDGDVDQKKFLRTWSSKKEGKNLKKIPSIMNRLKTRLSLLRRNLNLLKRQKGHVVWLREG